MRAGRTAVVLAIAVAWPSDGAAQVDRSRAPVADGSAGGFTVRRLSGPVTIDGRTWIRAEPIAVERTVRAANEQFTLALTERSERGDVVRFRLLLREGAGQPVALASDPVAYAFITPDSRWVVFEPLDVVDVRSWRRFSLSTSLGITPYIVLEAVSLDGRRLVISRRDCAVDCPTAPRDYYELLIPTTR
jgi:hypothetical protein